MPGAPAGAARIYYGWAVLLVAAAAMVGTLPGRTQGLGLITEPLMADLGLDRVGYAQLNFWATILGAGFALGIGRLLDRFGGRIVLTSLAGALGLVVCGTARAASFPQLAVWVTLTRGLGQSALSVISIALVGHWFARRIDTAMAVYSIVLSVGFMAAFPLVGWLVQAWGWRDAGFALGAALIAGLAPLSSLVVRRSPAAIGLAPDGGLPRSGEGRADGEHAGHTWQAALATPAFWVFALGTALYGLVASRIGLFNESILPTRRFPPPSYYTPSAVTPRP